MMMKHDDSALSNMASKGRANGYRND